MPLDGIHFDTFDGRSIPLSVATTSDIDRLRDRTPDRGAPIEEPLYVGAGDTDLLDDDDHVLGYVTDVGQADADRVRILNLHEIVNEELDGVPLVVTYCPLCRSGVVYDRRLDDREDRELTFGNTSALFDNDMAMHDHQTNTYWWHIAGRALVGELSGRELEPLPSTMALWGDWLERHPDPLVRASDTAFSRPYDRAEPFEGFRDRIAAGARPFPDAEVADGSSSWSAVPEGATEVRVSRSGRPPASLP